MELLVLPHVAHDLPPSVHGCVQGSLQDEAMTRSPGTFKEACSAHASECHQLGCWHEAWYSPVSTSSFGMHTRRAVRACSTYICASAVAANSSASGPQVVKNAPSLGSAGTLSILDSPPSASVRSGLSAPNCRCAGGSC